MNADHPERRPRFYFSFPRLVARLRGENSDRAVTNGREANIASVSIFAITYLFGCLALAAEMSHGSVVGILVLLIFAMWIFWVLLFHLNAVGLRLGRRIGIFGEVETVRAQGVLIVTETSLFAVALTLRGGWFAGAGFLWLIAVAVNLTSAVLLRLLNASRGAAR